MWGQAFEIYGNQQKMGSLRHRSGDRPPLMSVGYLQQAAKNNVILLTACAARWMAAPATEIGAFSLPAVILQKVDAPRRG